MKPFADRLHEAIQRKNSRVCVGLDPRLEKLPEPLRRGAEKDVELASKAFNEWSGAVIDAVKDHAVAVKPQIAFYEQLGPWGIPPYYAAVKYAQENGLLVIGDVKRGDISSTARAYAEAHLCAFGADAITVNPYFGTDGIQPFLDVAKEKGGGLFILVKTSNKSSAELQDLKVDGRAIYRIMGERVVQWGEALKGSSGYSSVGAVVGATHPDVAAELRAAMPRTFFLVPGFGAQGAGAKDVAASFNADKSGAIVNASRSIIFAYGSKTEGWQADITAAAEKMKNEINQALSG